MMNRWSRWQRCQKEGIMMPWVMRCPKWQGHKMGTRCPKQIRFKMSWILVQWCNHPAPSGAKSRDDTPEIWCKSIRWRETEEIQDSVEYRGYQNDQKRIWSQLKSTVLKESEKCGLHKRSIALVLKILKRIFRALKCVRCRFWARKWIQNGPISQGCNFCAILSTFRNQVNP